MLSRLRDHLSERPAGWAASLIAAAFVALPSLAFVVATPHVIPTGDTVPVIATVVQMNRHGDRDLSGYCNPPRQGCWATLSEPNAEPYWLRPSASGNGWYSAYPAGMEVFAWPAVLAADAAGWPIENANWQFEIELRLARIVGGICLGLFFLAGLCVARPSAVFVTTILLATGSVVTTTLSQLLWQQSGVVVGILVVLLVELRCRGRVGRSGTLVQAIACSLMLACRPSSITFLVPFGAWVFIRDWRRGLLLPALALAAYLPWAAMYRSIYGGLFGPGMIGLDVKWMPGANIGGVLFSPGRGLLVYQPWMWLLLLLARREIRAGQTQPLPPGWYSFCLVVIACHVFLVGSWPAWWGGCCWGSRLGAEVIPLAGLLVLQPVGWLLARRWGECVLVLVAAAGLLVQLPYLYGDGRWWNGAVDCNEHTEALWDWRHPPFLHRESR